MKQIAAGGFKDITRIASSSPIMWEQICRQNKDNIILLMRQYIDSLEAIENILLTEEFHEIYNLFEESKTYRDSIDERSFGPIKKSFSLYCDVPDETGVNKKFVCILADNNISLKNIGIIHNRELKMVF
jgi:prephenate dehydrogenase